MVSDPVHMSHKSVVSNLVATKEDHASKVLVVGVDWELGQKVVEALLEINAQVTVLVDQLTNTAELSQRLDKLGQVKVVARDVYQPMAGDESLTGGAEKFDYVFWLQQLHHAQSDKRVSVEQMMAATVGMSHVLNQALKWQAKVVLATTVYYQKQELGLHSTDLTRMAEEMARQYSRDYGLRVGVVKLARLSLDQALATDKQVQNWNQVLVRGGRLWLYPSVNERYLFTKTERAVTEIIQMAYSSKRYEDKLIIDGMMSRVETTNAVGLLAGVEVGHDTEKIEGLDTQILKHNKKLHEIAEQVDIKNEQAVAFLAEWMQRVLEVDKKKQREKISGATNKQTGLTLTNQRVKKMKGKNWKIPKLGRGWWVLALTTVVLICLPLVIVGGLLYQSGQDMRRLNRAVESGNMHELSKSAAAAKKRFIQTREVVQKLYPAAEWIGMGNKVEQTSELLAMLARLTGGAEALAAGYEPAEALVGVVLGGDNYPVGEEIERLRVAVAAAEEELAFAQGILASQQQQLTQITAFGLGDSFSMMAEKLPRLREALEQTKTIVPLLPNLLASESKKTYLVLLQNNMELRPTGGFIGSFGLMTFNEGKLVDFKVEDVYTADGQLRGHVEPPKELKENLGEVGWYLRDANWDPDFPTSARRVEWFLRKELGRDVDGVIAVNLYTLQKLLKALGPVTLHDYDETVTAENLFERAEYYAEVDFFPGSAQKRNFLSALTKQILIEMEGVDPKQLVGLTQGMVESLNEKQTMIYMHDRVLQNQIEQLSWSGELGRVSCESGATNCYADRLGIFEANVGVNKANYFVDREIKYEITLAKDLNKAIGLVTLDFRNRAKSESWPGGKYKNYLRIVLPPRVEVKRASIGRVLVPDEAMMVDSLPDKTVVGFLVEVPVLSQTKVQVKYELPLNLSSKQGRVNYRWWWQKQSGIGVEPVRMVVNYPAYLKLARVYPDGKFGDQKAEFNITTRTDEVVRLDFVVNK